MGGTISAAAPPFRFGPQVFFDSLSGILVGLFGLLVLVGPNVKGCRGLMLTAPTRCSHGRTLGIVSIPLGFLAAWLGTILSREPASGEMWEELRVRVLTGLGAEEAEAAPATRPTG